MAFGRGGFHTWQQLPKLWIGGGEIVEHPDDETSESNFRFLPQIFVGILLPMSKASPPHVNCAQDVAGIAMTDECMHLPTCFVTSNAWPTLIPKLYLRYG